ncbi:MAG: GNAT family N-acetyltransferase [Gammaproteobacteria bacterium]|nr:GNAT family N-acetyltransferase [Gammaproteobacteria bacterium]
MSANAYEIRLAERRDLAEIVEIYNHYVMNTHFTFDIEPFSVDTRGAWWAQFDNARSQCWGIFTDGNLGGYACSVPFKAKRAYETSVEVSVYLDVDNTGRGLGGRLYERLLSELSLQDVHRAYAGIALPNEPSVKFHERFGFNQVATFNEVGRKFDRFWDVAWYERSCEQ